MEGGGQRATHPMNPPAPPPQTCQTAAPTTTMNYLHWVLSMAPSTGKCVHNLLIYNHVTVVSVGLGMELGAQGYRYVVQTV